MTIAEAVAAIGGGGIVGMPTDTVYGLAVDPFDEQALHRLHGLKGRPAHKPIGLLVASVAQAMEIVALSESGRRLAEAHWPGPLTVVAAPIVVVPDWVGHAVTRTVGVRVPDHPTALAFLREAGPLAVTSANRSGEPPVLDSAAARAIFGDDVAGYLPGSSPGGTASTVVDVTSEPPVVLREGPVRI